MLISLHPKKSSTENRAEMRLGEKMNQLSPNFSRKSLRLCSSGRLNKFRKKNLNNFFLSKGRRKNQSVFLVYSIEEQGLPKCTIEKIYIKQQVLPPLLWSPRAVKIVPRRCRASQILRLSYVHTRHILTYQPPSRCRKPRWCSPPKSSSPSFQLSPR